MADDTEDHEQREMGVEFGELSDELDEYDYPATSEELIEDYGDRELDMPGGSESFREILEPQGDTTFEDAEEVRQAVFNMVGTEAVGRARYSDRGDSHTDDDETV